MLEKEFQFYLNNQKELVEKFEGKHIVIIGEEVIGVYDTEEDAFNDASSKHELGTFLIQLCEAGDDSYTQVFHTRVAFV
ncbi:DUF5678 domain-containing protein [Limibacter armeniacum]|uniref:DUF5678 domain-containing protein n=1 Tax=Limibacter armeniacum TaxID=466084 RepID=UPI002FE698A7